MRVLAAEIGGAGEMALRVILSSVLGLAATLGMASALQLETSSKFNPLLQRHFN